jgi:hypothetical protein
MSHISWYELLDVQVHLNSADLSGFQVAASDVLQRYRYKNLKAALCHIPDGKEIGGPVSTKVRGSWWLVARERACYCCC